MPKAWNFFEVAHSTWTTLDNLLEHSISEGALTTLIIYVELQRGDSTEEGELTKEGELTT
jgi:hypothetical protein